MARDDLYSHPILGWLRTLALGGLTFVGVLYVAYYVALWADPPDLKPHVGMVLGQVLVALVSGTVLSIAVMILDRRGQRRRRLAVISSYTDPAPARALRRR